MVGAVFADDVIDDLSAAFFAEIYIEIGHTDALGIEKSLKQQLILDRIDTGDPDAVRA